jgi:hypothetical protein
MKIIPFALALFITLNGCKSSVPYKGNKDLFGDWEGKTVEITAQSERVSFPMYKYGFATFTLYNDSTYYYSMEITRDVVLEKEVFGNPYAKTILKSGYKNYKRGYYLASSSKIILYDANKIISKEYGYYFDKQTLYIKFKDKENKQWLISWEK